MSGILANTVSRTMTDGDTAPSNVVDLYLTNERVTLTVTPAATTCAWALSGPTGAQAALTDAALTIASFVPDVEGQWVIVCQVDGVTTYVMRMGVLQLGSVRRVPVLELPQISDAQVQDPTGETIRAYNSVEHGGTVTRDSSGTTRPMVGGGNVDGPGLATNQAITRWSGTAGNQLQNSVVTVSDAGNINVPDGATVDGRDVSSDGTKLDSISSGAQPTSFPLVKSALGGATSTVDLNGQELTTSAVPGSSSSLTNRAYVDAIAAGHRLTNGADARATANLTLSGTQTIDGVTGGDGKRIFADGQTNHVERGLWVMHSGAWTRPTDFATGDHATGSSIFVSGGTLWINTGWGCNTLGPTDVIDTDPLTFTQTSAPGSINFSTGLSQVGSTVSVTTPLTEGNVRSAIGAATATIDTNAQQVTCSAAPSGGTSLCNKTYVDGVGAASQVTMYDSLGASLGAVTQQQFFGLDARSVAGRPRVAPYARYPRTMVRLRSTANLGSGLTAFTVPANPTPISPGYTTSYMTIASTVINGLGVTTSDRVFLTGQTNPDENGLYEYNGVSGQRLYRCSALDELAATAHGIHISVQEGSNAGYFLWSAGGITVDEDRGFGYHGADIDDFWLSTDPTTSDGPDMLKAWNRAHDAASKGGLVTFNRRDKYFFSGPVDVFKGTKLRGHSHVPNAPQSSTRLQFRGTTSLVGVRSVVAPGYPTAGYSGAPTLESLTIENIDSNLASASADGVVALGALRMHDCTVWNWSGNGVRLVAYASGTKSAVTIACTFDGSFAGCGANALQVQVSGTGTGSQPAVIFKNTGIVAAGAGTVNVSFAPTNVGPYTAPAGTLTVLVSPPTGFLSATNAADAVPGLYPSNANVSKISDSYFRQNGKWGIFVDGPDTNACTFAHCNASANGLRDLIGGDGFADGGGFFDSCFIGNTWLQCHAASNHGYAYRSDGVSSTSVFVGCYQEGGQVSRVKAPNGVVGGTIVNEAATNLVGITTNGTTNGVMLRGAVHYTGVSSSPSGVQRIDMPGSDTLQTLSNTEDAQALSWQFNSSGAMAHTYSWFHQGALQRTAFGITNAAHAYGPGTFIAYNGVVMGTTLKINGTVGATRPLVSSSTPGSPSISNGFWAVGHQFSDGKTWWGVQAKDGSNNLTWQFISSRGAHTTLGNGNGSVTASPYTVDLQDHRIHVNVAGACTINLPAVATKFCVIVKDTSGAAGTNNITLHRAGSESIDGVAADKVISTNYGALEVWSDGTNCWTR